MDVFGIAGASGAYLRAAAIAGACDLDVFAALATPRTVGELATALGVGPRRLRALVDVLVAVGVLGRVGDRVVARAIPARPDLPPDGWGRLADVIRSDRPLELPGGELARRYHRHLAEAGAAPARELMQLLGTRDSLLDLGGGAGAYTRAFLAANPAARATLVDVPDVVALAREELAAGVTFIGGDARDVALGEHDIALLANVLHLHGPAIARELVAAAMRAAPTVVIQDLDVAGDRSGPLSGLLFALNMAVFTGEGDVYPVSQLRGWLAEAGATDLEEHRLAAAPDAIVVVGRR